MTEETAAAAAAEANPTPAAGTETPAPQPAAAAVATETPAAAVVETPAAATETPAAAAEEAAAAVAGEKPAEPGSLLGTDAAKTPEPKPAAAAEPAAAEPPAAPTYEPFTLPDGLPRDDATLTEVSELAGKHGLSQEAAQEWVNFGTQWQQRLADHMAEQQRTVFAETRRGWTEEFAKDPEIGGNRQDTSLNEARTAIGWIFGIGLPGKALEGDALAKAEAGRGKLWNAMAYTGAGDHPEFIRAWTRAYRLMAPLFNEAKAPLPSDLPAHRPGGGDAPTRRYPQMTTEQPSQRGA